MRYTSGHGSTGAIYGLGVIGALIYYIPQAVGLWSGIIAILKALAWPIFIVYELLVFLAA